MGEVKDAVRGVAPARVKGTTNLPDGQNLVQMLSALSEELARLTAIKEEDALSEGDAAKPENVRKAATLSACFRMATAMRALLEDY